VAPHRGVRARRAAARERAARELSPALPFLPSRLGGSGGLPVLVLASTRQSAPVSSLSAVRERVGLVKFFLWCTNQLVPVVRASPVRAQFVRESFVSE